MEIGNEISGKIRAAIKAKLIDLGSYVDDELPDYIMVMIANRKTEQQMADDLQLFLSANTEKFTTWLHSLLTKLQAITQAAEAGGQGESNNKPEETQSTDQETADRASPTDKHKEQKPPDKPKHKKHKESQKSAKGSSSSKDGKDSKTDEAKMKTDTDPDALEIIVKADDFVEEEKQSTTTDKSTTKTSVTKPTGTASKVKPTVRRSSNQRMSVIGSVVKHESDSDGESDHIKTLSSVVRVSGRRSSVPAKLQANKKLLLRAVSDAEKSVEKQAGKTQAVQPIQRALYTRSNRQKNRDASTIKELQQRQKETKSDDELEDYEEQEDTRQIHRDPSQTNMPVDMDISQVDSEDLDFLDTTLDDTDSLPDNRRIVKSDRKESIPSPKFIVTLDGVETSGTEDENMVMEENVTEPLPLIPVHTTTTPVFPVSNPLKRGSSSQPHRLSLQIPDNDIDMESEEEIENNTSPRKRPKLIHSNEKCKFWPSCAVGDSCPYHHPSTQCKTFPKCKFGDKCLFIHPNCKFDAHCTRPECPFTHASKRNLPNTSAASAATFVLSQPKLLIPTIQSALRETMMSHVMASMDPQLTHHPLTKPKASKANPNKCRFFPKCTNVNCPYDHPKPCRFGLRCHHQDTTCPFSHPELPTRSALKWTSAKQPAAHISERPFSHSNSSKHIYTPAT